MLLLALPPLLLHLVGAVQLHREPEKVFKCVVFHSQHKSGGATIEGKLSRFPLKSSGVPIEEWNECKTCKLHCDRENWRCEEQTCPEDGFTPPSTQQVAFKGYTPLLAGSKEWGSPGDGKCTWATISREPVSRLVSAYYYCKLAWEKDPLCGSDAIDIKSATLKEFAKHWGNFLFRELLWNPELRALAATRDDYLPETKCRKRSWIDPWVGYKQQLNGGDDPRTKSGKENFEAVKEKLQSGQLYDVYGVLEQYNETMALFDEYIPFEGTTWMIENLVHGMHAAHGSTGSTIREVDDDHQSGWKEEEEKDLKRARNDAEILSELSGDIELYNDVILPMFAKKTRHLKANLAQIMQDALDKKGWAYMNTGPETDIELDKRGIREEFLVDY